MTEVLDVSNASPTAEYCPQCGRHIEWILRRDVMVPRQGVAEQPFRFMPCGCYVNPRDEPPARPREIWTA